LILDNNYNSRLDMEAIITASGDFPIEKFARDKGIVIPAVLTIGDNRESFLYYFEDIEEQDRDTAMFLKVNNARKKDNVLTLYSNSTHHMEYSFFRNLIAIPTLVVDFQYVKEGSHYFHVRFHSKYLKEFSDLVSSEAFPAINSVRYLGDNRKSVENAKKFFSFFKVMRISYRFVLPGGRGTDRTFPSISGDYAGEIRYISENKKICFNIYTKSMEKVIPKNETEHRADGEITEVTFQNELLNEIIFLSEHVAFPNFGIYFTRRNDIYRFEALIPAVYCKEYMKKVFNVSGKSPQWGMTLDNASEAAFEN
jgi:hypothetical protein